MAAMTTEHILRPATPTDVPAILRLIRGLAEYEDLLDYAIVTESDLHAALFGTQPHAHAILAEVGGAPVGTALFYYTFSTFRARRNLFLEDLFVDPAHRGQGIGLALMRELAQRAVAGNCGRVEWRVLNWNQPAIEFYQKIGSNPVQNWHSQQLGGTALAALAKGISHG